VERSTRPTLTAGIFDLGGVLIDWNPRNLYRKLFPDDEPGMERFLAEVTPPEWNRQLDGGRSFRDAVAEQQAAHPQHAELIQAYVDRWPEMLGDVNAEVAALVTELRERGLSVFALSNWSAETYPIALGRVPELRLFDDVLISGDAGTTKPDPRIFELACERFGVEPEQAFFVDDQPENVAAAEEHGLTSILFTGAQELRVTLTALGAL
jgi:2-haloacid dehalogenase